MHQYLHTNSDSCLIISKTSEPTKNILQFYRTRVYKFSSTCIRERRSAYRVLVERPEGKRPLGRIGVDGRIIL
jgi:hypothetical protein